MRHTRSRLLVIFSICLLAVAACTPSYINTEDLGTRSTPEAIRAHYAGKSVRYASEFGGTLDTEAYYGADGIYKLVRLDQPAFALGTWKLHNALGSTTVVIDAKGYFVEGGKVSSQIVRHGYVVYIQPDGGAKMDEMGGGNYTQPKPVRGFPSEARWNALRRQAGI